jgi:hypothetical protein
VDGYTFDAEVWLWTGDAAWHFLTVPQDVSDEIEVRTAEQQRGFGSVRVRVTVGSTTWSTSVFPDRSREAYILPVKKEVREREGIAAGDRVSVRIELVDA